MSRRAGRSANKMATNWFRVFLYGGGLSLAFVVGVLVGQLNPRPIEPYFLLGSDSRSPAEETSQRMVAPIPESTFTFYDELVDSAESRAAAPDEVPPPESDASVVEEELPPSSERTIHRVSPDDSGSTTESSSGSGDSPSTPRRLSRDTQESGAAGGEGNTEAQREVARGPTPEEGPPQPARDEGNEPRRLARQSPPQEEPSTTEAVGIDEEVGGSPDEEPPASETSTSRAPANPVDREIGSVADWTTARQIRDVLRSEGAAVAVISVEEPGEERRIAIVSQGSASTEELGLLRARVSELVND